MHERWVRIRRLRVALAVLAAVTAVGVGALGTVATALGWDGLLTPGPSWDDRYTITSYTAVGTLEGTSLRVVEDIEVVWHEPRRGLIRDVDATAPDGRRVGLRDVEVTSRTQDDVWFSLEDDGIHLGEEFDDRPLGEDHYRIAYVLEDLLVAVDGRATLRWDTFGDQWTTLIERAEVTLELPAGDHDLACVVGARGEAYTCDGDGPTWSAQQLRPGRGMTVEARLASQTAATGGLPRAELDPLTEFSHVARQRIGLVGGLVTAGVLPLLGSLGTPWARRRRATARARVDTAGVTYAPPRGMRPLTAGLLVHGESTGASDDELFAAWLLDLQQRGLIEAREAEQGFRVRATGQGRPDSDAEASALSSLTAVDGSWVSWNAGMSQTRRTSFQKAWTSLRAYHQGLAGVPQLASGRLGRAGGLVAGAGGVLAVGLLWLTPPAGLAVAFGLAAAWGTATLTDRWARVGVADLDEPQLGAWREVEGLRRFVAEAHADQIAGLADDPNVPLTSPFLELLPWVVALGEGERWAERFPAQLRDATGSAYAPVRARDVSAARAVARPPSSSSSGGGSSGVGSGGGGGGGSSR
jgi:hypothetical protein